MDDSPEYRVYLDHLTATPCQQLNESVCHLIRTVSRDVVEEIIKGPQLCPGQPLDGVCCGDVDLTGHGRPP